LLPVLGLIIGVLIGLLLRDVIVIPAEYSRYLSIGLLVALDSALGGIRSSLAKTFSDRAFVIGLLANLAMASLIVFLGDRLGVDLFLAAVVVFGVRIFNNLSRIRRSLFPLSQGAKDVDIVDGSD